MFLLNALGILRSELTFFFPLTVGSTRGHCQYDNTNNPASLSRIFAIVRSFTKLTLVRPLALDVKTKLLTPRGQVETQPDLLFVSSTPSFPFHHHFLVAVRLDHSQSS